MTNTIIALGGGGFTQEPKNPLLDLYILASAGKKTPKICFLPTASGDNQGYINFFEKVFQQYPCSTSCLEVFSPSTSNMEEVLLDADIILVGGGNTKSMLALWREWGVDKILKKAYEQGIVLAGVSAGMVCWFDECITDSIPHKFTTLPCLGLLSGSACPHYDGQEGRPDAYHQLIASKAISPGYAVDDGVGLHFKNGKLLRAVSSRPHAKAYWVYMDEDGYSQEEVIEPDYLDIEDNFNKHISTVLEPEELN